MLKGKIEIEIEIEKKKTPLNEQCFVRWCTIKTSPLLA
jgi:hypothetical protein